VLPCKAEEWLPEAGSQYSIRRNRLCVVPNMRRVDSYVVLIRQPLEILLRAAGFDAQTRV
jgi:hypothetical protein